MGIRVFSFLFAFPFVHHPRFFLGDVDSDGNCLFTAAMKAMGSVKVAGPRELRQRTVKRFVEDFGSDDGPGRDAADEAIRHLYSPDLMAGWGIHVVQEVKLLARKADRGGLDLAIQELVDLGIQREIAAESIYKERCIPVNDGPSWAKYMSISGSPEDEYDIITLQYTEEGLLSVEENRCGHAAAFGDDIAIESLVTEFKREVYVAGKKEEGEFNTGPLSVLMMSVKNNTQVLIETTRSYLAVSGLLTATATWSLRM